MQAGKAAHARVELPAALGLDLAGVVAAVGAEVTDFEPGDEVYGLRDARRVVRSGTHLPRACRQRAGLGIAFARPAVVPRRDHAGASENKSLWCF
ncbi:alcohol dehydrogenase catalytic domain-containing protein [Micromonospora sp. NPDC047644]|uniref:alcohol dehydrogenase catalytic domain-containing protein n=1 Tax=Micromonospora sp. NPDC047644 TaxID=3157203 RepID=UPI00345193B1